MQANLANQTITTAQALAVVPGGPFKLVDAPTSLCVQATFTYGSGGTTVNAYVQTTVDNGLTWIDIAQFSFATTSARMVFNLNSQTPVTTQYAATDGTLAANTAKDGVLGPIFQVKLVTTGTYAGGTTLKIDVSAQEP
jgi:hypothetical protein